MQDAEVARAVGGMAIMGFFCFGGALVSALIGGLIGNRRERGLAGAFLGFFLGPLGWIIALLLDYKYQCPFCKGGVPKGSRVCKNCGREFGQKAVAEAPPSA